MRPLIDREMTRNVSCISQMILRRYFYYDYEGIEVFNKHFAKLINGEHTNLYLHASDEFRYFIWGNIEARQKFTANFLDFYLLETLSRALNFNEAEIIHFENLLYRYLKEVEPVEHAQNYERANDRNPFTPL
jgi:hypothetical protein